MDELRARSHSLRTFSSQAAAAIEAVRTRKTESGRMADEYREASRRVVHEASNPLSIIKNYLAVLDAKVKIELYIQNTLGAAFSSPQTRPGSEPIVEITVVSQIGIKISIISQAIQNQEIVIDFNDVIIGW